MNLNQLTDDYKSLYLQVSGGSDSALGLYLICKHITENNLSSKVTVSTWVEPQPHFPRNDKNVKKIVSIINDMFPDIKIKVEIHELTGYTKEWQGQSPKFNAIKKYKDKAKPLWANIDYLTIAFITAGPPVEIVEKNDKWYRIAMNHGLESRFSGKKQNDTITGKVWRPFVNIHKKDLANLYHKYDLMKTLFPYTASCTGDSETTNNFTRPCGKCFWCYEKKWAFNMIDQPEAYNL